MSQYYHQGVYSLLNGFERSSVHQQDKLRVQGFDEESGGVPAYEAASGMLSEMFRYFPPGETATATGTLENRVSGSYGNSRPSLPGVTATGDWFLNPRQEVMVGGVLGSLVDSKNQIPSIDADDPAAVMQLFLMNPQQQSSPSTSPPSISTSSSLHMLLPDPSSNSATPLGFHNAAAGLGFGRITWPGQDGGSGIHPSHTPGLLLEGEGLSLSLSSSLQQLEAAKGYNLRIQAFGGAYHLHSGVDQALQMQAGLGPSCGAFQMLKNSKYTRSAQELLEELCTVGGIGQYLKKNNRSKQNNNANAISSDQPAGVTSGGNSSSKSKDLPPPSASDRLEHQRRKVKLLSMLDEVDRKYSHYCGQIQMVMNSFDTVMGSGAAVQYTSQARKAMSKHFRCLKEAISAQLKLSCEILGEKVATSGLTKGETPRLRVLEQSLRQHRGIHQMGFVEQEAWRPQRGLPDRSVNILRAWLFEHFLNPYPNDADKHLLARQTGLSRNQVSNWFINARVRLWKPMVEEMYQKESKEESEEQEQDQISNSRIMDNAKTPTGRRTVDSSSVAWTAPPLATVSLADIPLPAANTPTRTCHHAGVVSRAAVCSTGNHLLNGGIESTLVRTLGASVGDVVSLTLGLQKLGDVNLI